MNTMSKTSIEIDERKLRTVRGILGTRTKRDTVDAALDDVIHRRQREQLVQRLKTMDGLDLDDAGVMASAWR
jgi:Arc/MetJ family transcription regulator